MSKKNKQKNITSRKKGFTILETLVAISILILSITGPIVFTQNALRASFLARDQITAFFLAQDAIEYIKWVRNENLLEIYQTPAGGTPGDWLEGLDECVDDSKTCTIDTTADSPDTASDIKSCISDEEGCNTDHPLKKDNNGVYGFGGTDDSIFSRSINIKEIVPDTEAEVTVTIKWKSHESVGEREIVVKENIFYVLSKD